MKIVRRQMEDRQTGEEAAGNQVSGEATDDSMTLDDAILGDAPGTGHAGAETAGEDAVNAALADLLAGHPEAIFYAIAANARTVPMPASVRLNGHAVIEGNHSALDLVVPSDRGVVIDTWERALKTGIARADLRLAANPDRRVMLLFLDAQAQHGVYLGAITACDRADDAAIAHEAPARSPRLSRVRKDGLAVLREIDEAFTRILGWQPEEVLGTRARDLIHPDDEALAVDNWMEVLASPGSGRRIRLRHRHRDGSWVWIEVTNHNLLEDPEQHCVVADMVDISEEMATQEALRAREQLLDRLAEALPLGLLQVDSDARVVYTNERLHSIVGTSRASTVDEQLQTVVDEDHHVVSEAFARVLSEGIDSDIEVRVRPGGGGKGPMRLCSLNLRALTDASGAATGAIVCLADVTESARMRDELRARATFDAVTGCQNRLSVMAALEALLGLDCADRRPAVIFVDLDHFKDVNDTLGHAAGDEFLRAVAERLRRCVREGDVVGRIGGDEFLVICPHISAEAEAMNTAARITSSLCRRIRLGKVSVPSSASVGVAWSSEPSATAENLVSQADAAMYVSKRASNGKAVLFEEAMLGTQKPGAWQWPAPPDDA